MSPYVWWQAELQEECNMLRDDSQKLREEVHACARDRVHTPCTDGHSFDSAVMLRLQGHAGAVAT